MKLIMLTLEALEGRVNQLKSCTNKKKRSRLAIAPPRRTKLNYTRTSQFHRMTVTTVSVINSKHLHAAIIKITNINHSVLVYCYPTRTIPFGTK